MDYKKKVIEEAITHFRHGITHDLFTEPVTTYARLAIEALETQMDTAKAVRPDLICDVNPTEIASHIANGTLHQWCEAWQIAAKTVAEPGRWVERKLEWFLYRCSQCNGGADVRTPFCPHCGSMMGG